jgi:hypothetical protein
MSIDQDEAMLYLQRLMTATSEINEALAHHLEAIAELLATHKNRQIWVDDLERARESMGVCIQRSRDILFDKAKAFEPATIEAIVREVRAANRKEKALMDRLKRGALSSDEKRRILDDLLK